LQEQRFERVGSNETLQTSVRVLAATNHNLEERVQQGRFRKDLYYRLNTITIQVPPLRARLNDVAELAHYFLFRFNRELGLDLRGFAPEAVDLLQSYSWPGNVRELQSAIKQAMLKATGYTVLPEFLPQTVRREATPPDLAPFDQGPGWDRLVESLLEDGRGNVHQRAIDAVERTLLTRVLQHTHGHLTKASEILGLNRTTLRHKLRSLGLAVDKTITDDHRTEAPEDGNS
jgi:two-component system nitrogen regulation response regulator GlnG